MPELIPVSAFKHPFEYAYIKMELPYGLTIYEMIEIAQPDPILREYGVVYVGGIAVPKDRWKYVRPKVGTVIRVLPHGGGAGKLLATIGLAIAIVAVSVVFPASALFIAPVLAIGGSLLLNYLLPPPVPQVSKFYGNDPVSYSISGMRNRLDAAWSKVPFLCGQFKIIPPYAAQPYREIISGQIYFRALFAISHGPINIDSMAIGPTDLADFTNVEIEFRRGYWSFNYRGNWSAASGSYPSDPSFSDTWIVSVPGTTGGITYKAGETITYHGFGVGSAAWDKNQDKSFQLFPDDIYEDSFSVSIDSPVVRASQVNADEIAIGIVFEKGICHVENSPPGHKKQATIRIRIEQSPYNQNLWTTIKETDISGIQTTPLYWGWNWKTSDYGAQDLNKKYEVRIRNLTGHQDEERNFGNFSWYLLRTVTVGNPVPVSSIAMIALRIKATGQLSGVIDQFSVTCTSVCKDYNAETGLWRWWPTSSPAAHFRHILQHPHRRIPLPDERLDFARLQYWDSIVRSQTREFNGVFDNKIKLLDALIQICRVGRASPCLRDLRFSVIIDEPKTSPMRMFTPANSWNYSGEMTHENVPHAYRIGYIDKNSDWSTQEVVVYDDGYTAANATIVDRVEWPGITSHNQAWKEGRFHIAQQRLRREIHKITTDFEYLACERGDLIALQYDIIAVGLASGRITSIVANGSNIDNFAVACGGITMVEGTSYAIRARQVVSGSQRTNYYPIETTPGDNIIAFYPSNPLSLADGPKIGDLVAIGEADRETLRCIVRDIEPKQDLSAELTLIAEAPGIHQAEFGSIPAYDPVVTAPFHLPIPIVINITSDARVMWVAGRTLMVSVVFTLRSIDIDGAQIHVIYLPSATDGQWQEAVVQEDSPGTCRIIGLNSGTNYDFRLYYSHRDYLSSPVTAINNYYVIGRSEPPDALQDLAIATIGGQALLTWDLPLDLDVQYGGWIVFRHSVLMTGATWTQSLPIGRAIVGDQNHVWLPLKPGTYMGKVYDVDALTSEVASISTKQASVLTYVGSGVSDIQEDPTFSGTKSGCELDDNVLKLSYAGGFDEVASVDAIMEWDSIGSAATNSGTYTFAAGFDFTTVQNIRLTSHIKAEAENTFATVDSEDPWDSLEDMDGTTGAPIDAQVWIRTTDDDPGGSPTWGDWILLHSAEVNCRAVGQIKLLLSTSDSAYNILVSELRIFAAKVS